uniref:Uridine kinase n=1 Tax=Rhabditophanes sp. KR3021 TaxID=114890 RepID=A0AC35TZI9_9BILA
MHPLDNAEYLTPQIVLPVTNTLNKPDNKLQNGSFGGEDEYDEIGYVCPEVLRRVSLGTPDLQNRCKIKNEDTLSTYKSASKGITLPKTTRSSFSRCLREYGSCGNHLFTTESGRRVYTKGRPPWYDQTGKPLKKPYVIGICGGSASGKTSVARNIIKQLGIPWITVLAMDSFYKVLNAEQHELASRDMYNFDTPDAFDFDLMETVFKRLLAGKSADVPVYNFTTHKREKNSIVMYGADVIIFEGILSFHKKFLVDNMDIKLFIETDSDICLARRLMRDVKERSRQCSGVISQYLTYVKPSFDLYISPDRRLADLIIPRGGRNKVAIDLISMQVNGQLGLRGYNPNKAGINNKDVVREVHFYNGVPENLVLINQTKQVVGLMTKIRDKDITRDEFIFYSDRFIRLLMEDTMNHMDYVPKTVEMRNGSLHEGIVKSRQFCGVSIMRAGETLEKALRNVVKDCKMGKMLIQTNPISIEPELYYLRIPRKIQNYKVLLLDATVATGSAAIMAIRVLLDHDVKEQDIVLCSLIMSEPGAHAIAYAFPKVKLITGAVDKTINDLCHVIPGIGNFGDRYFGTDSINLMNSEDEYSSDDDVRIYSTSGLPDIPNKTFIPPTFIEKSCQVKA